MDITILVKQVYWYISRVSGERLQDHWSSGFYYLTLCSMHGIAQYGPYYLALTVKFYYTILNIFKYEIHVLSMGLATT